MIRRASLLIVGFILVAVFMSNASAHPIMDYVYKQMDIGEGASISPYLKGHILLLDWQLDSVGEFVEQAKAAADSDPEAAYFLAHYYFLKADYFTAEKYLSKAVPKPEYPFSFFEERLAAALKVSANFERKQVGHFEFRFENKIDEILIEYASKTLEAARENIGRDLDYFPKHTVVVEFVTSQEELGALVGLDPKAIDTTGTIAICKFNRLIVTTPRVTTMGYHWLDTMAHEYTHLVIAEKSKNTVPIWLHEGIAKFEEKRWDSPPGGYLGPYSETLLAKALRTNSLIPLEKMHPSMALLPSKEAGATAFAEVLTIIQFLYKRHGGYENLRRLLVALSEGKKMDEALKSVYGFNLSGLERRWKRFLRSLSLKEKTDKEAVEVSYKGDSKARPKSEEDVGAAEEDLFMGKSKGARFFRLGKLLKDRKRYAAAIVELEKAMKYVGKRNVLLQNVYAKCLLNTGKPEEAKKALEPLLDLYDGPAMTYYNMGQACMALGDLDCAKKYFLETIGINPFDPRSHAYLSDIYARMGMDEEARREAGIYKRLQVYLTR